MVMLVSMLLEPSSGIDRDQERAASVQSDRPLTLLRDDGANACAREAVHEGVVGEDIERRLRHAVLGRPDRFLELAGEAPAPDEMRERQRDVGDRLQDAGESDRRAEAEKGVKVLADPRCAGHELLPSLRPLGCGVVI